MMILRMFELSILFILIISAESICAQSKQEKTETDSVIVKNVLFKLKDGSECFGDIIAENDSTVVVRNPKGYKLIILIDDIKKRELTEGKSVRGEFWRRDPNVVRTFLAPTARPVRAREGYISDIFIVIPSITIGLTDYLSFLGGVTPIFGADIPFYYFAPKFTPFHFNSGAWETDISIGGIFVKVPNVSSLNGFAYLLGSAGSENEFVTFGLASDFGFGRLNPRPIYLLSGYFRILSHWAIITENWLNIGGNRNFSSFGIRFFEKHFATDVAIVRWQENSKDGYFPWFLSFAFNF